MPDSRGVSGALSTIEASLPNGFHDAILYEVRLHPGSGLVELAVGVDVSSAAKGEKMPIFKQCRIDVSGIEWFQLEPFRVPNRLGGKDHVTIDGGVLDGDRLRAAYAADLPQRAWAYWFFLRESNSFIHIVARNAALEWL